MIARVLDLDRICASENLKRWERTAIKLIGANRPPKSKSRIFVREYRPEDIDRCLFLLNQYKDRVKLSLVWERDELGWELDYSGVSKTLVCEKEGRVEGLINYITACSRKAARRSMMQRLMSESLLKDFLSRKEGRLSKSP